MNKVSCIYKITNIINNKKYIGSAINFNKRKIHHLHKLRNNKHHSKRLQNAFNKYKEENFIFEIIITCPKEYLIKLEQWFLDTLNPEYNIAKIAGSTLGIPMKQHVKEAIRKSKENYVVSKETRERMSRASKGRKRTKEAIEKTITTKKLKYNGDVMSIEARINAIKITKIKNTKPKISKIKKVMFYEKIKGKKLYEVVGVERATEIGNSISKAKIGQRYGKQSEEHRIKRANSNKSRILVIDHNNNSEYEVRGIKDFAISNNIPYEPLFYTMKNVNGYIKKLNVTIKRI